VEIGVRNATNMPDLQEDMAAFFMHRLGD
jgi:hypothetical protein